MRAICAPYVDTASGSRHGVETPLPMRCARLAEFSSDMMMRLAGIRLGESRSMTLGAPRGSVQG